MEQVVLRDWTTRAGLRAVVVLNRLRTPGLALAWRCGYVQVPSDSALHGRRYQDVDARVHGGLTFSESYVPARQVERGGGEWWLGFDCAHAFDEIGFNFGGTGALKPHVRAIGYVSRECERLAEQVAGTRRAPRGDRDEGVNDGGVK